MMPDVFAFLLALYDINWFTELRRTFKMHVALRLIK